MVQVAAGQGKRKEYQERYSFTNTQHIKYRKRYLFYFMTTVRHLQELTDALLSVGL